MARLEASYDIAKYGLATSFQESEQPPQFALKFRNRFFNSAGGAEKRQGMSQLGDTIPGTPEIDSLHEYVDTSGNATLLASGEGKIFRFTGVSAWEQVHTGLNAAAKIRSVQFDKKMIFVNGEDRNLYIEDGSASSFERLRAVVIRGETAGTAATNRIDDANVTNWLTDTDAVDNDIVFNITKGGYSIVTDVVSGHVVMDTMASTATGLNKTVTNPDDGDRYAIFDLVELNVIPTDDIDDNTATAGTGTGATTIAVSGVNFLTTDIRPGDFVYNTTRSAVAMVSAVATSLTVTSVKSQVAGDALTFLTEAMPVATNAHVHYGRLYLVDANDEKKIRVSGPGDPEDFTSDTGSIDAVTFAFGEQQAEGEIVKDMASFQRFFAVGGRKNLLLFAGTDPIADTTAKSVSFDIIGSFPQGVVAPDAMLSIGNDLVFVTPDGVQTASLVGDASTLGRANVSEAIKTTLREKIAASSEEDILAIHYPRRSWFMVKIQSEIFVFNYSPFFGVDQTATGAAGGGQTNIGPNRGSWSVFDGKFARQNAYLVRQDGTMVCAGPGGKVYSFDNGTYTDDGEIFTTEYQTSWLTLSEPRKNTKIKQLNYIKPILNVGQATNYTIRAEGNFAADSTETITVAASGGAAVIGITNIPFIIGGSPIQNRKFPIRVRGEQMRITFTTEDSNGPDTIARFTLYANQFGVR